MKSQRGMVAAVLVAALMMGGCGSAAAPDVAEPVDPEPAAGTQVAYVEADDWGPVVSRSVVHFDRRIDAASVAAGDFVVSETKLGYVDMTTFEMGEVSSPRTVTDAYVSDETGERSETDSEYVTVCMATSPMEGGAFVYSLEQGSNDWTSPYRLDLAIADGESLTSEGAEITDIEVVPDVELAGDGKICPAEDGWNTGDSYTCENGMTFSYAEYAPEEDDGTNALVIWLHGGGECGTDPQIALLANKVTALSGDEFQTLMGGAYVLVPQCLPGTHWCADSEGDVVAEVQTYGAAESRYTGPLFELIDSYVASNHDIDASRILIGGCSAGGYMTMAQLFEHPDYYAAAFTASEAYYSAYITDDMIESIKDVPIWFTNAATDSIDPALATNAIYDRLVAAGAPDVHHSYFDDVHDTSGRFFGTTDNAMALGDDENTPYEYNGHFSWIYFDNNECFDENGLNEWEWLGGFAQAK